MAQMPLTKHDDMIKAVSPDRTDCPLAISVLPWRPCRNGPIPDAHGPDALDE
jgi:hypothetical protein